MWPVITQASIPQQDKLLLGILTLVWNLSTLLIPSILCYFISVVGCIFSTSLFEPSAIALVIMKLAWSYDISTNPDPYNQFWGFNKYIKFVDHESNSLTKCNTNLVKRPFWKGVPTIFPFRSQKETFEALDLDVSHKVFLSKEIDTWKNKKSKVLAFVRLFG